MSVELRNLTKLYGSQKALDDVSFRIAQGEVIGFLGPNGAGKSTTMKIICGYIPQTAGEVFVNDININQNPLAVKRIIGYLPEHNPLYLDMYVREYLQFVAEIYKLKNRTTQVSDIIEQTGLNKEISKKIGQLSKGYRQRVGLAAALIHKPEVLILDEPTSGLDPNQIVEIRNLIGQLGKEKTVILSTHIMQEVEAVCDRIIIINNGKIVADRQAKDLTKLSTTDRQTIIVEFNKETTSEQLFSISGVTEVQQLNAKQWLLQSTADTDIRESIFTFAVKNDLTILSQQRKEKSIEEVFRELTKT